MASKEMYALGSQASVIRDLFAYGQEQAAIVGKENVFDFSIGNPTVPAPACVKEAIEDILETRESVAIHGYTAASGDASSKARMTKSSSLRRSSRNIRSLSTMPMPKPSSCRRIRNTSRFLWTPWKRPLHRIHGQSSSIRRITRLASSTRLIPMKNWRPC